jgi:hypothetical protein
MAATSKPSQILAINFAALAREIAMDILPLQQILELHRLTDEEWAKIQANKNFQATVAQLVQEWNSAANVRERVKVKAATGLESNLEQYVLEISDTSIPLIQRVEAGKFLARLGELDGLRDNSGGGGDAFHITLNIGELRKQIDVKPQGPAMKTIEAIPDEH